MSKAVNRIERQKWSHRQKKRWMFFERTKNDPQKTKQKINNRDDNVPSLNENQEKMIQPI